MVDDQASGGGQRGAWAVVRYGGYLKSEQRSMIVLVKV
jgi:hypothetical protein